MRSDDEVFVNRCLEGDQGAFAFLVNKYKEVVHAYAYHKVGDYQEAQDIAQEVFIKAYSKLGQLKWPHRFQSWLYTIVSNECKMWHRKHSKEQEREVAWDDVPASESNELAIRAHNDEETKFTVKSAMETLPADNQLALSLYYMSDLSIKEIAHFMGISPNTVKGKLHRARRQLGERLEKMLEKQLKKEKLRTGFIFKMMGSIRNMPIPSVPKPPPMRWAPVPISIGVALLIGIIGFGISSGKNISEDIPILKPSERTFEVLLFDDREVLYMREADKNRIAMLNEEESTVTEAEVPLNTQLSASKTLENVPMLSWDRHCTFAGSVATIMEYLKEDVPYDFVAGVSGSAFKLLWLPPNGCPSNNAVLCLGNEGIISRTFDALPYQHEWIKKTEKAGEEEEFRRRIVQKIDRGLPVIIIGEEPFVASGYDQNGAVLLGQSYFQWGKRSENWYERTFSLILIGGKKNPPTRREIFRNALEWAVDLARAPRRRPDGHISGLAAYNAWAEALKTDDHFPRDDTESLKSSHLVHSTVTLAGLYGARKSAAVFLRSMADEAGSGKFDILAAARAYEEELPILDKALKLLPPHGRNPSEADKLKLGDPETRANLAELILEAREKEEKAVEHLERILKTL